MSEVTAGQGEGQLCWGARGLVCVLPPFPLPFLRVPQRKRPASERPPRPSKPPAVSRPGVRRGAAAGGTNSGDARGDDAGGKSGGRGRSGDGGNNTSDAAYTNGTMDSGRGDEGGNEDETGGGGEVGDFALHSSVPKDARGKRGARGGQRGNNLLLENSTSGGGSTLASVIPRYEGDPHTENGGVTDAPTLHSEGLGQSSDKDKAADGDSLPTAGAEGLNSSGTVVGRVGGRTLKVKISMKQRL